MITFSLTSISDKLQKLVNFIEEREDQELTKINNNFEEVVGSEKKTVAKNKDKSVAVASIGVLIGLSVIVVGAVSDEYSVKIGLIASGAALTIISTIIPLSQKLSRKNDPSPSSDNASEINDKQDPLTSDQ